jgi:hypothetical protein
VTFFSASSVHTDISVRVAARYLVGLDGSKLPRQLLDERISEVVARLKRVLVEMRVRPDVPGVEWAGELAALLSLMHGLTPTMG